MFRVGYRATRLFSTSVVSGNHAALVDMSAKDGGFRKYLETVDPKEQEDHVKKINAVRNVYSKLQVEPIIKDAGKLDPNFDVGEWVRFQLVEEQKTKNPPWFYPIPEPRFVPKGTRLVFKYKFKHDFLHGIEPPVNRKCQMGVMISTLGLSKQEKFILSKIAEGRARGNYLLITCQDRPTVRENEVLCLVQLDELIRVSKEISAKLQVPLTAEQIQELESKLPAEKTARIIPHERNTVLDRMKAKDEVEFDDISDSFGDLFDSTGTDLSFLNKKIEGKMTADEIALAVKNGEIDIQELDEVLDMNEISEEDFDAVMLDLEMKRIDEIDSDSPDSQEAIIEEVSEEVKAEENASKSKKEKKSKSPKEEALVEETSTESKKEKKSKSVKKDVEVAPEEVKVEETTSEKKEKKSKSAKKEVDVTPEETKVEETSSESKKDKKKDKKKK